MGPRKVHKRLARHVARTCQARRRLCKVMHVCVRVRMRDIRCRCCCWIRFCRLRAFFRLCIVMVSRCETYSCFNVLTPA